jgi:hypothetical protein
VLLTLQSTISSEILPVICLSSHWVFCLHPSTQLIPWIICMQPSPQCRKIIFKCHLADRIILIQICLSFCALLLCLRYYNNNTSPVISH